MPMCTGSRHTVGFGCISKGKNPVNNGFNLASVILLDAGIRQQDG